MIRRASSRVKTPLLHRRKLDAEEGVGVGDQLLERARDQPIEPASVVWPDRPAKEAVGRALLVAGSVLLQHRPERFGEQGSAWDVEQRGLEQDEGVDEFRRVERQPQGDDAAGGMADDVGTLDAEVPQQGAAIGSLLAETERRSDRAAAGVAAPVVAQQAVAAVQRPARRRAARTPRR